VSKLHQDPVLGPLTWDASNAWWTFDAGPVGGRSVRALIIPDSNWEALSETSLTRIRACVQWIRSNEPAIRAYIGAEMFDWWLDAYYDEDIDTVRTPEEFAATIELAGISFDSGGPARVVYEDNNLVGGHGIWLSVGPNGEFSDGPDITG
jgi:hypothetical protein